MLCSIESEKTLLLSLASHWTIGDCFGFIHLANPLSNPSQLVALQAPIDFDSTAGHTNLCDVRKRLESDSPLC